MPRECQYGHPVSKGRLSCENGHRAVLTLKCDVPNCNFVTDPVDPKRMVLAIQLLRMHMQGAHILSMDKN